MLDDLKNSALDYHRLPRPGKIEIAPTKPLATQRDLALAYSPGVAFACEAIDENPRPRPATSPRAATSSAWSPTAPPCWAWATSARSPPSP